MKRIMKFLATTLDTLADVAEQLKNVGCGNCNPEYLQRRIYTSFTLMDSEHCKNFDLEQTVMMLQR